MQSCKHHQDKSPGSPDSCVTIGCSFSLQMRKYVIRWDGMGGDTKSSRRWNQWGTLKSKSMAFPLGLPKINQESTISIKHDHVNTRLISRELSKSPCFQVVNGLFVHGKVSEVLWEILLLSCHQLLHMFKVEKLGKWSNVCLFGNSPLFTKIPKSWKIKPTERLVPLKKCSSKTSHLYMSICPENSVQALHAFLLLISTHHSPIPASIEEQATVFIGKLAATACTTMSWSGGGNISKVVLRRWLWLLLWACRRRERNGKEAHTHTVFATSCYSIICWLSSVLESLYTITISSDSFVFYDLMQNQNSNSIRLKDWHSVTYKSSLGCEVIHEVIWLILSPRSFMPKLPTFVWESRFTQSMFIQSQQQSLLRWVGNDTLWLFPDD